MTIERHLEHRYGSDAGASAYRRKYEKSLFRRLSSRRELAVVDETLRELGPATRMLDCPCGAGRLTPVLLRHTAHVTAVDLSQAMIHQAQDALRSQADAGRIEFRVGSADELPCETDAFEVAVCHRLIHHVMDRNARAAIYGELARVASRQVVLSFNDASTFKMRWQARRGRKRRRIAWTPASFAEEVRPHGLTLRAPVRRLNGLFSLVAVAAFDVEKSRAGA